MAAGPYRDALAAVKERVRLLEAERERRDDRLNALHLALVPEELENRVGELRARLGRQPEATLAGWTEREADLGVLLRALDEAETLVPVLELGKLTPVLPAPKGSRPFLLEEFRHLQLRQQVEAELAQDARRLARKRWGDDAYFWVFTLEGVDFKLYARTTIESIAEAPSVELAVYASMPSELGPVFVAPAGWWYGDATRALLGEVDLGELELAERFRVRGDPRQARALLVGAVQRCLLALHANDARLEIADGIATLSWGLADVAWDETRFGVLIAARALLTMRRMLE